MKTDEFCKYLEWDSQFFGLRIARVTVNILTQQNIECIMTWCNAHSIDCLYFLSTSNDPVTVKLAETNEFHLVDVRITLEKQLDNIPVSGKKFLESGFHLSNSADIPYLQEIARVNYGDSRFYYDPNFPTDLCDTLYETWIEKSCHGFADAVIVAEFKGQPSGYVSCHLLTHTQGKIDLVGLREDVRGKGLGTKMIATSLQWFAGQGVTHVIVVTQGRNIKAQRLYQKCGFLTQTVQLWYHRWFASRKEFKT